MEDRCEAAVGVVTMSLGSSGWLRHSIYLEAVEVPSPPAYKTPYAIRVLKVYGNDICDLGLSSMYRKQRLASLHNVFHPWARGWRSFGPPPFGPGLWSWCFGLGSFALVP